MNKTQNKPVVLCIMDGWGLDKKSEFNAVELAQTPNFDYLSKNYPYSTLDASGEAVGLPKGQVGNSEVGHMNLGSGRVVLQTLPKIDTAFSNDKIKQIKNFKSFYQIIIKAKQFIYLDYAVMAVSILIAIISLEWQNYYTRKI